MSVDDNLYKIKPKFQVQNAWQIKQGQHLPRLGTSQAWTLKWASKHILCFSVLSSIEARGKKKKPTEVPGLAAPTASQVPSLAAFAAPNLSIKTFQSNLMKMQPSINCHQVARLAIILTAFAFIPLWTYTSKSGGWGSALETSERLAVPGPRFSCILVFPVFSCILGNSVALPVPKAVFFHLSVWLIGQGGWKLRRRVRFLAGRSSGRKVSLGRKLQSCNFLYFFKTWNF